ncbi:MAG: GNAT family N-acetyltransferase [Kiritimatiellae bacterium]|nr:GNAT family N-acetyltransferase [Kiritimatiellia bacterium]
MKEQLHMIWPEDSTQVPEQIAPDGYEIRPMRKGDENGYVSLMHEAGFSNWNKKRLSEWQRTLALPDGIFVATYKETGKIVATAMASHRPLKLHPAGGELGWVAASPDHTGKGLGKAMCVAALRCFMHAGYKCVYLLTDDHRMAAIKIYLQIGFLPFLCAPDMEPRWQMIYKQLQHTKQIPSEISL